ncbi:MAG: aminodeoxychorismate/anthranilate synthase component II [Gammaproteobacteria bacterium]|nr:aminodeoxychorismate/anthranilate synthase component II [Gammaproteobacteria bacterium]
MILMIDNYDSFTFNVVQYLGELGADVVVHRNDEITVEEIVRMKPEKIVISPGPCTPNEAGISMAVIDRFADELPILGICLGHQSIGQALGGKVSRAHDVMHGKTSLIYHAGVGLFRDLPSPFSATRYHSLIVEWDGLPPELEVTAWTQKEDGSRDEIMAVRHRTLPMQGVQFHPESILTEHGHTMLKNFLEGRN